MKSPNYKVKIGIVGCGAIGSRMATTSSAAWLAGELGASDLVLVKSADPGLGSAPPGEFVKAGCVDRRFPEYLARSGTRCWYAQAQEYTVIAELLVADGESLEQWHGLGGICSLAVIRTEIARANRTDGGFGPAKAGP